MSREMKDSGIDCIGQIPSDWDLMRFKFCLDEQLKYGANESGVEYQPDLPRYIRITDINSDGTLKEEGKLSLNEEQANGFLLKDGDILFARSGATVGKSFLYKSEYGNSAFAGYLIKASVNKIVIPEFVNYITQSSYYDIWKDQIFTQATIQNISAEKYNQLPIVIPSKEEQQRIVHFLNKKTDAINSIIQKQKDIVIKLSEYKQSMITQVVTNGFEHNVEMKKTSISGLTNIPKTWNVVPLKTLFSFSKGLSITKSDLTDEGIKVISYGQIHSKNCDGVHATNELIRFTADEFKSNNSLAKCGGFIFADTSEDLEGCGNAIYITDEVYGGYHTVVLNPKEVHDYRYLAYLFKTDAWRTELRKQLTEVKVFSITQFALKNMHVILPSYEEMVQIADFLDSKCSKINESIERSNKIIQKLEEYKKVLIYNAVTGKIDCRGEVK